jgi:peptidoglycan hydrolase-like protein with peptidoglycan-binding domain
MLVQSELARRGYYDGPDYGVIDPGSRMAIRESQTAEGLPITGQMDESFLRALEQENLPKSSPSVPM